MAVTSWLQVLHESRSRGEKPPPNLTEEEWPHIGAIIELLRPFQIATQLLSAQQCPTIPLMLPLLFSLEQKLCDNVEDLEAVKELKPLLYEHFAKIQHEWKELDDLHHLASFLDVRTKVNLSITFIIV